LLDTESIKKYLESSISSKRYVHSINVSVTAAKLAEQYGCDVLKADVAGLVHDCAKELDMEQLLDCLSEENIATDEMTLNTKELLHGPAAVHICRTVFGIEDKEILSAVRYHITGRENMTLLEKIIYLSDFIEPSRSFEGVEELRELATKDLDRALLFAFNSSIVYLISKNGSIHMDTILARNYMLEGL
jgi:predicted HD superfamily hydrolase involved in NAD metabolism